MSPAARQRNNILMNSRQVEESTVETPLLEEHATEETLEVGDTRSNNNNNDNDNDQHTTTSSGSDGSSSGSATCISLMSLCRHVCSLMLSPFTDEQDSPASIVVGLFTLTILGSVLGSLMPTNPALPSAWYRTLSSLMGYTCFTFWSVSFYPQMIRNFRRRTTTGLSADFCALNVAGFACYAIYTLSLFYSVTIQREYRQRYGAQAEITVQSNDVAFAVHSFVLASITLGQVLYYDGLSASHKFSRTILSFLVIVGAVAILFPLLILVGICHSWLDYLYVLSFVKIGVTLVKYVPQVYLNRYRRSTDGFSIWQILLDFSGGTLNNLQLIGDAADLHDWTGITGNPAKLCLGMVSMVFDVIFMTQHYVLYKHRGRPSMIGLATSSAESLDGLMVEEEGDNAETARVEGTV